SSTCVIATTPRRVRQTRSHLPPVPPCKPVWPRRLKCCAGASIGSRSWSVARWWSSISALTPRMRRNLSGLIRRECCALPQRLAAHLGLKGSSACTQLTPCNRRAKESFRPVYGVARHPHGARALPETLAVGRPFCHRPWPRKRRPFPHVLGDKKRLRLLLA